MDLAWEGFWSYNTCRNTCLGVAMQKKLTITVDERIYEACTPSSGGAHQSVHRVPGPAPRHRQGPGIAYQQMAQDEAREAEALDWAEATVGDVADEAR